MKFNIGKYEKYCDCIKSSHNWNKIIARQNYSPSLYSQCSECLGNQGLTGNGVGTSDIKALQTIIWNLQEAARSNRDEIHTICELWGWKTLIFGVFVGTLDDSFVSKLPSVCVASVVSDVSACWSVCFLRLHVRTGFANFCDSFSAVNSPGRTEGSSLISFGVFRFWNKFAQYRLISRLARL